MRINAVLKLVAVLLLWFSPIALAQSVTSWHRHAVVRIPSHGGSGTIVASKKGETWILSCAHMFEGDDRRRPIIVNVPSARPNRTPRKVGVELIAVSYRRDLSLIRLNYGPLPYVCPIAPRNHQIPGRLTSSGYDEMKPQTNRVADVVSITRDTIFTRQAPWHGRSGGGLLDTKSGYLVGVVQGYEVDNPGTRFARPGRGFYGSLASVHEFLAESRGKGRAPVSPRPVPPPLYSVPGGT